MKKHPASYPQGLKSLFKNYVRDCRRRNVFWELSIDEFQEFTKANCTYCGKVPSQDRNGYKYNGLDRMEPKRGYEASNVTACCKECNWLKSNRLTVEEMKAVGGALARFRLKQK